MNCEKPDKPDVDQGLCIECGERRVLFENLQMCGLCAFNGGHIRLTDAGRKYLESLKAN